MLKSDKEKRVLSVLQEEGQALSLRDLLSILEGDYRERTVRRWLSKMAEAGLIEKTGSKRGTRYRALQIEDKPISKSTPQIAEQLPFVFSTQSQVALAFVRQPIFKRNPVAYNSAWLEDYQPNQTHYVGQEISEQLFQAGQRAVDEAPGGTYAHRIYNRLLIDLTYNSSRLEGNTYSLLDTKNLVVDGVEAEGKLDEETVMILNHKEAIRHLVSNARDKLSVDFNEICTLHYLLADGLVDTKDAGKPRDHGVRITGSTYIPLENTTLLEKQLNLICYKAITIDDPYEQSFFLLVHIAYLQSFADVNKRTARLSANIPLILNNLVPLSFNDVEKNDYISAMFAIYELNETQPLLDLYKASYLRTCQLYNKTVESLGFDDVRVRYRQLRRDIIRTIIADRLSESAMQKYIEKEAEMHVHKEERERFLKDISDDLNEIISNNRIAGLGITREQLQAWLRSK